MASFIMSNWDRFDGVDDGGMHASKLSGRLENVAWTPPMFKFDIERHGAAVHGSAYAEIQSWSVNLSQGVARLSKSGRRRIGDIDKPLDVKPIAREIAAAIATGAVHPMVRIKSSDRVILDIAAIIPATNNQTTAARRKRFNVFLASILAPHGWQKVAQSGKPVFTKVADAGVSAKPDEPVEWRTPHLAKTPSKPTTSSKPRR